MFSDLLSILDRLIELLQSSRRAKREFFEEIVHPLFTQFEETGRDYLKFFQSMKVITAESRDWFQHVKELSAGREEYRASRIRLRATIEVMQKNISMCPRSIRSDVALFLRTIDQFFGLAGVNFELHDKHAFPSLAHQFDEYARWLAIAEQGRISWPIFFVSVFELIAHQEIYFGSDADRRRREELEKYLGKFVEQTSVNFRHAIESYTIIRLKVFGSAAVLGEGGKLWS